MINKILGKRIFKGDNLESTGTICKIRNSERIALTVEHMSGEKEVKDLTDTCDLETKEGIENLRKTLNDLTNMTDSKKSVQLKSVDIGFPVPFLKVFFKHVLIQLYYFTHFHIYENVKISGKRMRRS